MRKPWTEGPKELLQHAANHLRLAGDFDRRIALISVDNAVELIIKTYLGLPERARGSKGPGRKELETASDSFPSLLDLLERFVAEKVTDVDLTDIEWYHRLRNQLYHSGNGITVETAKVEAYFQIAMLLFQSLFDTALEIDDSNAVHTKTGEFLSLWTTFERKYREKLPPRERGELAYFWKKSFFESISKEAAELWSQLSEFRNYLVHADKAPASEEILFNLRNLKRLMQLIGITA